MFYRKGLLVVLAAVLLSGCLGTGNPLPTYPQARLLTNLGYKKDLSDGTLWMSMYDTYDTTEQVADFYNKELGAREGWKGGYKKGERFGRWSDGNIKYDKEAFDDPSRGEYVPKDPSKPGAYVQIIRMSSKPEHNEGGAFIKLVNYQPK